MSSNPISAITDPISGVLGTDGSGGGISGALADIDPGKAIGSGLADLDKFVGREIPGGWKTVGLVAASIAAPYAIGAMSAGSGATAGSFVAADAAGMAASGLSEAAIAQNLAFAGVEATVAADAAALAAGGLSEAAIAQNLTYAYGAELGTSAASAASSGAAPVYDYSMALEQFGPTYQELGITGVEGGMAGPTYGELGYTGLNPASDVGAAASGASGMSTAQKAMMGMQLGKGLLAGQPQQQQNPYQQQVARQQSPRGQVDYSGLLSLLQPRSSQRKTSLLG